VCLESPENKDMEGGRSGTESRGEKVPWHAVHVLAKSLER